MDQGIDIRKKSTDQVKPDFNDFLIDPLELDFSEEEESQKKNDLKMGGKKKYVRKGKKAQVTKTNKKMKERVKKMKCYQKDQKITDVVIAVNGMMGLLLSIWENNVFFKANDDGIRYQSSFYTVVLRIIISISTIILSKSPILT